MIAWEPHEKLKPARGILVGLLSLIATVLVGLSMGLLIAHVGASLRHWLR